MAAVEGPRGSAAASTWLGRCGGSSLGGAKRKRRGEQTSIRAAASSGKGRGGAATADLQLLRAEKRRWGRIEAGAPAEWIGAARARVIFQWQLGFARVAALADVQQIWDLRGGELTRA